jgi:hypothetical protein
MHSGLASLPRFSGRCPAHGAQMGNGFPGAARPVITLTTPSTRSRPTTYLIGGFGALQTRKIGHLSGADQTVPRKHDHH